MEQHNIDMEILLAIKNCYNKGATLDQIRWSLEQMGELSLSISHLENGFRAFFVQ